MAKLISIGWLLAVLASAKSLESGHGYGIIGGAPASITEFPHQVFMKYKEHGIWCGGTIISSLHILTATSCMGGARTDYVIISGTDRISVGGDVHTIYNVTNHPKIGLAVIRLTKKISLSDKAKPITLAGFNYIIRDRAVLIASGWGKTEDGTTTDKLKKVTIYKVIDDVCKKSFPFINLSNAFCAGGDGKKTCWFDDGGPIIERLGEGIYVLVGVTEYNGCYDDDSKIPSVFTKVSGVNEWITELVMRDVQ